MDLKSSPSPQRGAQTAEIRMAEPEAFTAIAADGYAIGGTCWRHKDDTGAMRPVVIINPATSVLARYYFRFATFLFEHGLDVVTFDYRGIGLSRPLKLRGFDAGWIDWGHFDFEAVLQAVNRSFLGQPIQVAAHSVGGFLVGLAPSSHLIERVFTMGAQYAYWRDYAPESRLRMVAKWHFLMPAVTAFFGYFPGRKLGWLEDTPKGVVRDWILSRERFEDTWRGRAAARYPDKATLVEGFANVTAPTLAISVTDDEFGTVPAIERLLAYFSRSPRTHLRISAAAIDEAAIGHFGFFNKRFESKLWPIALAWLCTGALPDGCPGTVIMRLPDGGAG